MIRLLEKNDFEQLINKYNFELNYLASLLDNMSEYMYISVGDEIDGFMICFDDGEDITIKKVLGNI